MCFIACFVQVLNNKAYNTTYIAYFVKTKSGNIAIQVINN